MGVKMRRSDREITDFKQILDILRRADTIRLALNGDTGSGSPYPYVVPLSFGFEAARGAAGGDMAMAVPVGEGNAAGRPAITLYFHGAAQGHKHDLIGLDCHVCVEAGIFHRYAKVGEGAGATITTEYESVIGFGEAQEVSGAEAERGMALILEHCGYAGFAYEMPPPHAMKVYKITLASVTGMRNGVQEEQSR